MIELDRIYNTDCLEGMRMIPDKSIDLVVTDPPYLLTGNRGEGLWGGENRKGMSQLEDIKDGFNERCLDELVRVMKKINIYLFCSQKQMPMLYRYFVGERDCNWNLLTWHKTNPVPACGNKYLNDTEFIMFFREKGVKIHGTFDTKRTWFASPVNLADKKQYGHPTCKPVDILSRLIINSSNEGDMILDPFMGSGSTAVACIRENRHFIGYELNEEYYLKSLERIGAER